MYDLNFGTQLKYKNCRGLRGLTNGSNNESFRYHMRELCVCRVGEKYIFYLIFYLEYIFFTFSILALIKFFTNSKEKKLFKKKIRSEKKMSFLTILQVRNSLMRSK